MKKCSQCKLDFSIYPLEDCSDLEHWKSYSKHATYQLNLLQSKLEMKDDDRDKYEIIERLKRYPKVKKYKCSGCKREYNIPVHLIYFSCVCGHRCKLRYFGAEPLEEELLDAAMNFFGNERIAQLAWIAEVVGGKHAITYTGDEIRKIIRNELDRWEETEDGWRKKQ